jgi:Rrf2 family transcriptional regulator, iron-sulfur cluster assembly transcription factor
MHISKSAGYAVHGLIYLITKSANQPVQISEIAEYQNVSRTYLAKIFQQLSTARIIVGQRGITGGYMLAKEPTKVTLLNIVEAVDGPVMRRHCCLGVMGCDVRDHCSVLDIFVEANTRFANYLDGITLASIVNKQLVFNPQYAFKKTRAKK